MTCGAKKRTHEQKSNLGKNGWRPQTKVPWIVNYQAWLNHEGFWTKVPRWWAEGATINSAVLTFTAKLRHCRLRIREWCNTEFYSIREQKRLLMEEIHRFDLKEELGTLAEECREEKRA